MPQLIYSIAPNGLLLPAILGPDTVVMQRLQAQGAQLPKPLQVRAQIDTGTLVTAVGPGSLAALGVSPGGTSRTQTAGGIVLVKLFRISFTIFDAVGATTLTRPTWVVTDLPQDLPDVEVLFGMDLVRELNLNVNGPTARFTLDF